MVAEHLTERRVQQMRRGVVRHRREPVAPVDDGLDARTGLERRTLAERDDEHLVVAELEHVGDLEPLVLAVHLEIAGVGDLAAAGGVERALLELHELPRPVDRARSRRPRVSTLVFA